MANPYNTILFNQKELTWSKERKKGRKPTKEGGEGGAGYREFSDVDIIYCWCATNLFAKFF
jgi:hypothetical protein